MKSVGLWGAIVWLAISATDLSRPLFSVVHWGSWSLSPNYYALDDLRFTCVIEASIKSTFCMPNSLQGIRLKSSFMLSIHNCGHWPTHYARRQDTFRQHLEKSLAYLHSSSHGHGKTTDPKMIYTDMRLDIALFRKQVHWYFVPGGYCLAGRCI